MSEAVSLAIKQKCARKCADLDSKKSLMDRAKDVAGAALREAQDMALEYLEDLKDRIIAELKALIEPFVSMAKLIADVIPKLFTKDFWINEIYAMLPVELIKQVTRILNQMRVFFATCDCENL